MYQQKEQQIIGGGYLNGARRFESSISKFDKSSPHPHRRRYGFVGPKIENQYASFKGYTSSEESILRNKSKSTSSIDTASVNNTIDDYEYQHQQKLNYRKSSDFSEIGGIETSNYDEIMQLQKRQSAERSMVRQLKAHYQPLINEYPHNLSHAPVTKVSRQTQVQPRSRDRSRGSDRKLGEETNLNSRQKCHHNHDLDVRVSSRSVKIPEVLLKKGEVQKRVDEWLSQTRNQNFSPTKESKGLQRSNSNAEQKSHRRSRHHENRVRKCQLNASSSYDDLSHDGLRCDRERKVSVGVNTSRGTYRQYLALRNRAKMLKMQQECLENVARLQRSREVSPSSRPIHFRTEVTNLSFRSRNSEPTPDIWSNDPIQRYDSSRPKNSRSSRQMENRISGLVRARNEATNTNDSGIGMSPRRSFKRESMSATRGKKEAPPKESEVFKRVSQNGLPYSVDPPTPPQQKPKANLVSARVQAFQNREIESQASKSRVPQVIPIETNIKSPLHTRKNIGDLGRVSQSTFKPFDKIPASPTSPTADSPSSRSNGSIEKLYESSQFEVIHADNLESLLKPTRKNFFYGDRLSKELVDEPVPPVVKKDETTKSQGYINKIEHPTNLALVPTQKSPSFKGSKSTNALYRETDFTTFCESNQQVETKEISPKNLPNYVHKVSLSEILKSDDSQQAKIKPITYESRSTLKLNQIRNMTDYLDGNNRENASSNKTGNASPVDVDTTVATSFSQNNSDSSPKIIHHSDHNNKGTVISEVLVKNLQFKQDLIPAPPLPPPRTSVDSSNSKINARQQQQQQQQVVVELSPLMRPPPNKQPLNYNSVLSDDYTSLQSRTQLREKNKIYVTKEEMERQRLMDLLRKGEFDIVKAVRIFFNYTHRDA